MASETKTTTLRIRPELRARINELAAAEGISPHSFMLGAIEQCAQSAEHRQRMHAEAEQRMRRIAQTGDVLDWAEMKEYLESRAEGRAATPPQSRKLSSD